MADLLTWIFWLSAITVAHTYLIYPLVMVTFFRRSRTEISQYTRADNLPNVAVLVAAYNEEKVIGRKILSVFESDYPADRLHVYVGSDASVDATDTIIAGLQTRFPSLYLVKFDGRVGKINIINHLQSLGDEDILVMTDANVMFRRDTVFELVKMFRDDRVGIVAANIVRESPGNEGIAFQEKTYLSLENRLKAAESNAFNLVMGAEGGCYAIRNSVFSKVPLKFVVDDFYITLQVLVRGKFTLFNPKAVCDEDAITDPTGEYQRKLRISSGNFQNLMFFRRILWPFWKPAALAFWSHKVLRWLTPFLLIIAFITSMLLAIHQRFYLVVAIIQAIGILSPFIDWLMREISGGKQWRPFKFVSHFYLMNLALLVGFFRFLRGIESSVWQPVKRNV